jgi:hypothetical protein
MSSHVHEVSKFPLNAYGPVILGCVPYPDEVPMSQRLGHYFTPGIIGEYSNIVIHTDTSPPFTERYVTTGFNEEYGYGNCVPYSLDLVDEGLCANFNDIDDPIYVTPHGFPVRLYFQTNTCIYCIYIYIFATHTDIHIHIDTD